MKKIIPVLLAGGAGSRLWPLSRKSYPKQFSKIVGTSTLFQQSALRLTSSDLLAFDKHITLTNADFRFIVRDLLQQSGIEPGDILIEPEAKNTAPAILAASLCAIARDPEAILLVAPSDHIIPDTAAFHQAISVGLSQVERGKMVAFGITATYPETGYGYLELIKDDIDQYGVSRVLRFVEKPNMMACRDMLDDGNFFWNAGIFLFKAKDMVDAFAQYAQETARHVTQAVSMAHTDLGFLRLAPEPWAMIDGVSIDYAIMEKTTNLVAVAYASKWSDLGGWDAVWAETDKDEKGNAVSENAHAIDCSNSLLRSENAGQQIVGLGLDNIMAIAMPDAVLVAHKDDAQNIRHVVEFLKQNHIAQAEIFPKAHRPWGWFESLVLGDSFKVRRVCVNAGASLSLQSHKYRSEHWVVVEGVATVTIDDTKTLVSEGQSIYVPLGAVHRIENLDALPMILIEVQIGSYLGKDDIVRFDDAYNGSRQE